MAVNIQLRRDPAATWTTVNPVVAEGEIGYELDTGKIKVGDGINAWNDLPYRMTKEHGDLIGRSDADQHPISAITNLDTTLDGFLTPFDVIEGGAF